MTKVGRPRILFVNYGNIPPKVGDIRHAREIGKGGEPSNRFIWHACVQCGAERWVQIVKDKPTHILCANCGHDREKHPRWKGGRNQYRGYIQILLKSDDFFYPMVKKNGYVFEHRLVVARALGRCLQPWELVHHKHNKYPAGSKDDKQDNRYPQNLQLVTDDRHNQITILENKIRHLENRVILLEAENVRLEQQLTAKII